MSSFLASTPAVPPDAILAMPRRCCLDASVQVIAARQALSQAQVCVAVDERNVDRASGDLVEAQFGGRGLLSITV